jgi:uncharacterized protein (DUF1778 family)
MLDRQIVVRVQGDHLVALRAAAIIEGKSLSEFLRTAALERAVQLSPDANPDRWSRTHD